jgi:hypothetical protein
MPYITSLSSSYLHPWRPPPLFSLVPLRHSPTLHGLVCDPDERADTGSFVLIQDANRLVDGQYLMNTVSRGRPSPWVPGPWDREPILQVLL